MCYMCAAVPRPPRVCAALSVPMVLSCVCVLRPPRVCAALSVPTVLSSVCTTLLTVAQLSLSRLETDLHSWYTENSRVLQNMAGALD